MTETKPAPTAAPILGATAKPVLVLAVSLKRTTAASTWTEAARALADKVTADAPGWHDAVSDALTNLPDDGGSGSPTGPHKNGSCPHSRCGTRRSPFCG